MAITTRTPAPTLRRALAGSALALACALAGCGAPSGPASAPSPTPSPSVSPLPTRTPPIELPGGGEILFPRYRLCGYVGYPGATGQGRLGIGNIDERMTELHETCAPYAYGRQIMPTMELIAVTVQPAPGPDGKWRERIDPKIIDEWLAVAKKNDALLLLNIQPGQAHFIDEVKALEKYLIQPNVGVALDPEWAMGPGQVPMQSFGHTSGEELNEVAAYLSGLVAKHHLPEKVMLYHILHVDIISNEAALQPHPGVQLIKSVDGIGAPGAKVGTYNRVAEGVPPHVAMGFKLFYEEDVETSGALMTPDEVMAIQPEPMYVMYE